MCRCRDIQTLVHHFDSCFFHSASFYCLDLFGNETEDSKHTSSLVAMAPKKNNSK